MVKDILKKIRQYLVCFTCDASVSRPYIVAKHFEIMSTGSLLLAANINTKKYFEKLGFIDGQHYISMDYTNMNDKIAFVLDPLNRDIVDKIRLNGYEFVNKFHTYQKRAQYLVNILCDDLDKITYNTDGIHDSIYYSDKVFY